MAGTLNPSKSGMVGGLETALYQYGKGKYERQLRILHVDLGRFVCECFNFSFLVIYRIFSAPGFEERLLHVIRIHISSYTNLVSS